MKFPALALCLVGTLVATGAARADHTSDHHGNRAASLNDSYRDGDHNARDPYTGVSVHAGERLYFRDVLFPDLMDERTVAQQVSEIVAMQQHEIAMLNALAPRAQTAGWTNISTVYQHMAHDHGQLVNFASTWLTNRGYSVPNPPTTVAAADMAPDASVDQQLTMHQQMLNDMLERRRQSKSSTVRGMLLWAATGAAEHVSLLRTLDRDVDMNRRDLSAALRLQLAEPGTIIATNTELVEQYVAEERARFPLTEGPDVQVVEIERTIERPVEVERIVERPVTVERVVERVVEKPVYIQQPAPQSTVAGRRQTTTRARARRPAK